jgi:glc operon protein GlcG
MGKSTSASPATRRKLLTRLFGTGLVLGAVESSATAQSSIIFTQKGSLSIAGANLLVTVALAKAAEIGVPMSVAVVDESGILKAFSRMDGAGVATVDIVQNKAYTAAAFRSSTQALAQRSQDLPTQIASFTTTPHVTLLPGGLPISVGGVVIGGIGAGGGSGEQDALVAQTALSKVLGIG